MNTSGRDFLRMTFSLRACLASLLISLAPLLMDFIVWSCLDRFSARRTFLLLTVPFFLFTFPPVNGFLAMNFSDLANLLDNFLASSPQTMPWVLQTRLFRFRCHPQLQLQHLPS